MTNRTLFVLWGVLFVLCAGLGFGESSAFGLIVSLLFFVPPAVLLYRSGSDRHTLLLIRNLSALSLGLTLAALIGNFFTAFASEAVGQILYYILIMVSSPMVCSGHWAMSLFLWACLMIVSIRQLKR